MKTITHSKFTKLFNSQSPITVVETLDVLNALASDDDGPISLFEPHQLEGFKGLRDLCESKLSKLEGKVTYIDEMGNVGECSLQEMNDAQYDPEGDTTMDENEMESMRVMQVGETVRLNGWMGMYTDVTRVS